MDVIMLKRVFLMIILAVCILAIASGCASQQKATQKPPTPKPSTQVPAKQPVTPTPPVQVSGMEIYKSKCLGCHGLNGAGVKDKGPKLNTPEWKDSKKVMEIVKTGKESMPAYKGILNDPQITAVSDYVTTFK